MYKVSFIWEPEIDNNVELIKDALDKHPEISERLVYVGGCWVTKESFNAVGYQICDEGVALCEAFDRMLEEIDEYMDCTAINPINWDDPSALYQIRNWNNHGTVL